MQKSPQDARDDERQAAGRFAQQASARPTSAARELLDFLRQNKKWWLVPIVAVLLLVGALVILSGTAVAPLIYTLF